MNQAAAKAKRGRKAGPARQAGRLLEIEQQLRAAHMSIRVNLFAHDHSVSMRQVQRDLKQLERFGLALERGKDADGFSTVSMSRPHGAEAARATLASRISTTEFVALAIDAARVALGRGAGPWADDLASAYGKLVRGCCAVPVEVSRRPVDGAGDEDIANEVYDAIVDGICRACEVCALPLDAKRPPVLLSPCALVVAPSSLGALCCETDGTFRVVSLAGFGDADADHDTHRGRPSRKAIADAVRAFEAA